MTIEERMYICAELAKDLQQLSGETRQSLMRQAKAGNLWFTEENVQLAIDAIIHSLRPERVKNWLSSYTLAAKPKRVGVVSSANTPAEGFHDCMCVLLSGHILMAKLHEQDTVLMKSLLKMLPAINPDLEKKIIIADRLNHMDAIIATVNEKTVGQFNRYFNQIPHIIRSQKKSCAILRGDETAAELLALGNDMLYYFGLGNRNVSKVYVPEGYSFRAFYDSIKSWQAISEHNRYVNNYDYNKSILLINQQPHHDNGFLLLYENNRLVSPVAMVHYEQYAHADDLPGQLAAHRGHLQSIVSQNGWYPESISFGNTAIPALEDYLGGIDTMLFLSSL